MFISLHIHAHKHACNMHMHAIHMHMYTHKLSLSLSPSPSPPLSVRFSQARGSSLDNGWPLLPGPVVTANSAVAQVISTK